MSEKRCPTCDASNSAENSSCRLCGAALAELPAKTGRAFNVASLLPFLLAGMVALAAFMTRANADPLPAVAQQTLAPTATPSASPTRATTVLAEAAIQIASATPVPQTSATATTTTTPTPTETPRPTTTPQPPRQHTISEGENLILLSLFYGVTVDSIIDANGLNPNAIVAGSQIDIPWPTATPPLEPVLVTINGREVLADPTGCELHEVSEGDSLFGLAFIYDVPYEAILDVNRLTERSLLNPGDPICIPQLVYDEVLADLLTGELAVDDAIEEPSIRLFAPQQDARVPGASIWLQWLSAETLASDMLYMIEVTQLDAVGLPPLRYFTRSTAWQLDSADFPPTSQDRTIRWRVQPVRATGFRDDGSPTYSFAAPPVEATFRWQSR